MPDGQIFNALIDFFEEDDWEFTWLDGTPILSMGFSGKNGKWMCYAQAREDQHQFVFYSVCPINAPKYRRHAVAEFITRANYGMIIGNFEMDYEDGEIRYKTSIDVEGTSLLPALVKQMVYSNVLITDRYLPGLMRIIYGNVSPSAEIERIENETFSLSDDDDDDDAAFEGDEELFDEDDFDDDDLDDEPPHTNGSSPN
jgi:hypothetical protein